MIPPRESLGKGRQNYIDTIPDAFQRDICKCKDDIGFKKYLKIIPSGKVGITVHTKCNKPSNLWAYIEECENCGDYYIVTQYPDRNLLCEGCDASN